MLTDVLIVDDDRNMRATLKEILLDEGYSVTTASCGEEAVALCDAQRFRVILLDVRMPGIDGFEALDRIGGKQSRSPVVLMSAHANSTAEAAARSRGALAFLHKPLNLDALRNVISSVASSNVLWVGNAANMDGVIQALLGEQG